MRADTAFRGMEEVEECARLVDDSLGIRFAVCEGLGLEVQGAEVSGGDYNDGRLGKQKRPITQAANGIHSIRLHSKDAKRQARQRDLAIELPEQRRSSEW